MPMMVSDCVFSPLIRLGILKHIFLTKISKSFKSSDFNYLESFCSEWTVPVDPVQ